MFWDVNEDFSSEYIKDHCTIQNELLDGIRTAWLYKYMTSLYTTETESAGDLGFNLYLIIRDGSKPVNSITFP